MNTSKAKALIIEDESINAQLWSIALKDSFLTIDLAKNYTQAIELLNNSSYDLLILDIGLPDKSGIEIIKNLRAANNDAFIVVITAYSNADVIIDCVNAGCDKFHLKPIDINTVKNYTLEAFKHYQERKQRTEFENLLKTMYTTLQYAPSAIFITDPKGIISYCNEAAAHLSGYMHDELIGQKMSILKSDHHSKEFYADMWRTILSKRRWRGEIKNKRKDGTFYWESAEIIPYLDDNGEILYFIGVKEDITDRKEYELTLAALSPYLPDLIIISTDDGQILNTIPSREDLIDKHINDAFSDTHANTLLETFASVRSSQQPSLVLLEGEQTVEAHVAAFNGWRMITVCRDITGRQEFEMVRQWKKGLSDSIKLTQQTILNRRANNGRFAEH